MARSDPRGRPGRPAGRDRPRQAAHRPPEPGALMTPKRVYVNLAAFTLVFLALAAWAVTNVIKLDRIENPYHVTAYFQDAPGLRRNVEVSYLGVSVGHVTTVRLAHG